jgi:hypothetical protein
MRRVSPREAFPDSEAVQPSHGHQRTTGGGRRQRTVLVVPFPEPGQEGGDILLRDVGQVGEPGRRELVEVAAQVPAVRRQRVGGEAALDGQVVQVRRDGPGRGRGAQPSASASEVSGIACASATGA